MVDDPQGQPLKDDQTAKKTEPPKTELAPFDEDSSLDSAADQILDRPPKGAGPVYVIIAVVLALSLAFVVYYLYKASYAPPDVGPPPPPPVSVATANVSSPLRSEPPLKDPATEEESAADLTSTESETIEESPAPKEPVRLTFPPVSDQGSDEGALPASSTQEEEDETPGPANLTQAEESAPVDLTTQEPLDSAAQTSLGTDQGEATLNVTGSAPTSSPENAGPLATLADPNPEDLTTEEIPGPENVRPVDSLLVVDSSELVDEDAANLTSQPAPKPMRTADLGQGSLTVVPTSTLPLENAEPPLESQPASEPGLDSAATLVAKARAATVEESGVTSVEEPTNETKAQKSPVPLETDSPKSGQKEADSQKSGQKEADSQNSDLKASPPKTASQTSLSPKSEASPKVLAAPDKSGAASGEPQVTPNADLNPPLEPDKPKESPLAADPNDEEAIAEVWVSNLHSTPDEAESQKVWSQVANLTGFGRLYRYDTTVGGIRQWRIRLGFFETREEAEAASGRLLSEAKIGGTPWLVRPTVAERNKYIGQSLSAFWVVNIASTPNQADSEKFWLALEGEKAKNYLNNLKPMAGQKTPKIYRSEAVVNGQKHFRIRLGFFTDQKEAEAAGQALTKAAGLSPSQIGRPWATRPTVDEVKAQEVL